MKAFVAALCVSVSLASVPLLTGCAHKAQIQKAAKKLIKIDKMITSNDQVDLDDCISCITDFYDATNKSCATCCSRLRKRCVDIIERIRQFVADKMQYDFI